LSATISFLTRGGKKGRGRGENVPLFSLPNGVKIRGGVRSDGLAAEGREGKEKKKQNLGVRPRPKREKKKKR